MSPVAVRVYVPSSPWRLRQLAGLPSGSHVRSDGGLAAYAVTEAARAAYPKAGEEELEYLAMATAGVASTALLEEEEPPRRLVLAVDVHGAEPRPGEDPFAVVATGYRWPDDVASYHVDSGDAEESVRLARLAWTERAEGWEDAVAGTADHELGWYAAGELPALLALLAGGDGSW